MSHINFFTGKIYKMKNLFFLLMIFITLTEISLAQVTQSNNTPPGVPGPFLGWNTLGGAIPLEIKTELAQNINFYTNAGAGTFLNQRVIIRGSNNMNTYTDNTGWVGIGNTMPMSILHIGQSNCYSGQECWPGVLAGGWRPWMSTGLCI